MAAGELGMGMIGLTFSEARSWPRCGALPAGLEEL
jgi:hypothetical protein